VIAEEGSELASELWATPHPATSSILAYPEGRAALAAARRGARLTAAVHRRALEDFESPHGELLLIGIDMQLAREAGQLAEKFALRGYDAVHLASALSAGDAITLVSWDENLRRAAARNGCAVASSRPAPARLPRTKAGGLRYPAGREPQPGTTIAWWER
jgi:predicted nucleic acid-binding protein